MVAYTLYPSDARVRREAETLAALDGYAVSVIALKEHPAPRRYRMGGVEVVELNLGKYRGKSQKRYFLSYFVFLVHAALEISRRMVRGQVDVVHVHNMPNFIVMAAILPKLFNRRVILDMHDPMPETYAAKFEGKPHPVAWHLLRLEERISARLADHLICVNHVQKEALGSRGRLTKPLSVVLNVPDPRLFKTVPLRRGNLRSTENFNIVYHGTVTKRLGIDMALHAIRRLNTRITGLRYFVLGTGDDLDDFVRLRDALGLKNAVHFNGRMLPVDQLVGKLRGMDMGLISNRKNLATEMMLPVKMLEYFALGIPVVAPRLKAIERYCDETMLSFYEPEQLDSMVEAIHGLYSDLARCRRQVEKAGRFLERFGWDRHKVELLSLYQL